MADAGNLNLSLQDILKLRAGLKIKGDNEFLKAYDSNNNSIFDSSELEQFTKDIEQAAGVDKKLQINELVDLVAKKLNLKSDKAEEMANKVAEDICGEKDSLLSEQDLKNKSQEMSTQMFKELDKKIGFNSVGSDKFKNSFNEINEENIVYVLDAFSEKSGGKTLPRMILEQQTSKLGEQCACVDKLYKMLLSQVDKTKYDTSEVEALYNDIIKRPQAVYDDRKQICKKCDLLFSTLVSMVKGSKAAYVADDEENKEKANNSIKSRNDEASQIIDNTYNSKGVITKVLDKCSFLWGSKSKEKLEKSIEQSNKNLQELDALKNDPKAYAAKFKEIYGVEYKASAVEQYDKIDAKYQNALKLYMIENIFKETHAEALQGKSLKELAQAKTSNNSAEELKKQEEIIYKKEYDLLCSEFTKEVVDKILEEQNALNADIETKYSVLQNLVKSINEVNSKAYKDSLGDSLSLEQLARERKGAFHSAYGLKNDNLLEAEDWQTCLQNAYTGVHVGMTIMATAATFAGGVPALLAGAFILIDPITFAETSTDADGMTAEDYKNYGLSRLETVGWMAMGGAIGAAAKSVRGYVQLRGLAQLASKAGKSLDDLIKAGGVPAELASEAKAIQILAKTVGITTDAALNMTAMAMLQKDGVTTGDWVMTIATSIAGHTLCDKLAKMPQAEQIKTLQATFPKFNLSAEDAKKILNKIGLGIKKANDKVYNATSYKATGATYCATPLFLAYRLGQALVHLSSAAIDKLGKLCSKNYLDEQELKCIKKYSSKSYFTKNQDKAAEAMQEVMNEITGRMLDGQTPCKEMYNDIISRVSTKYGLEKYELEANTLSAMDETETFCCISNYFEKDLSSIQAKSVTGNVNSFKNAKALDDVPPEAKTTSEPDAEPPAETPTTETNVDADTNSGKVDISKPEVAQQEKQPVAEAKSDTDVKAKSAAEEASNKDIDTESTLDVDDNLLQAEHAKARELGVPSDELDEVDNLLNKLLAMKENKEPLTSDDLEAMIYEIDARKKPFESIKKYLLNNDKIKNYINDNTHYDIYENPAYADSEGFDDDTRKTAASILDKIFACVDDSNPLTEDVLNNALEGQSEEVQQIVKEILQNHWKLGKVYQNFNT